jgi:hypothetical protein
VCPLQKHFCPSSWQWSLLYCTSDTRHTTLQISHGLCYWKAIQRHIKSSHSWDNILRMIILMAVELKIHATCWSSWWLRQYAPLKRRPTSRYHIPASCNLHSRRHENLKSLPYTFISVLHGHEHSSSCSGLLYLQAKTLGTFRKDDYCSLLGWNAVQLCM